RRFDERVEALRDRRGGEHHHHARRRGLEILVVFGLDALLVKLDVELVTVELVGVVPIVVVEFVFWRLEQWTCKHDRSPSQRGGRFEMSGLVAGHLSYIPSERAHDSQLRIPRAMPRQPQKPLSAANTSAS